MPPPVCTSYRRLFSAFSFRRSTARNSAGIYHLDDRLQRLVFGEKLAPPTAKVSSQQELIDISLRHLENSGLLGHETQKPEPLDFDLPQLIPDSDLDEHFQKIGSHMSQPYLQWSLESIQTKIKKPENIEWVLKPGWVRYAPGQNPQPVSYPQEKVISFDTEVLFKINEHAVMATAVSADASYVWLSPWLLGKSDSPSHLIPLGPNKQVVIGHYVAFDRKRTEEEYTLKKSPKWFMDTMSLHIATNGMCNQQRPTYMKFEKLADDIASGQSKDPAQDHRAMLAILKQEPWLAHTSSNSLADVVKFHLGQTVPKADRDLFSELSREEASDPNMLQRLITYCMSDSWYAKQIFNVLLPRFLELNPHPVTIGALRLLNSAFLPVSKGWQLYVDTAEMYFDNLQELLNDKLQKLADEAVTYVDDPDKHAKAQEDPWLRQLDWTVTPIKYTKAKPGQPSRPVKNQKMPGKPQWYKDLFSGKVMNLTTRTRTTTLLLRLKWDNKPLVWENDYGWGFWADKSEKSHFKQLSYTHVLDDANRGALFKLPHPDGEKARCTNPLAKYYLPYFESGTLSSDNKTAMDAIATNLESSYWISARQRIMAQMPVYKTNTSGLNMDLPEGWGMILPRMAPMGAVTRRAVEDTWLTASNAKENRLGSELKSNIRAPPGYVIVGADVDSEELWIAGVIGDSLFKMHGGTAMGWMTLEGTKKAGTDLHSKSAEILGISRNNAKVFNYGRIYGAGQASASRKLRQFNPSLSVEEAEAKAENLYRSTKGVKTASKHFPLQKYWRGGTESVIYNQLELLAEQPRQRTPVLGAGITDALVAKNLRKNSFLTTRVNWTIQSSGVDYLHLLIASMHYLCETYHIDARLLLTVHDEVRYLVKDEEKYRAGLALQIANLWTRAMFCQQLGLDSLPRSVAFFSLIDFDTVLRKEVDDPCLTPTQPNLLLPGEACDMASLIKRCDTLGEADRLKAAEFAVQPSMPRVPVMERINESPLLLDFVRAQVSTKEEAAEIEKNLSNQLTSKRSTSVKSKGTTRSDNKSGYRARPQVPTVQVHENLGDSSDERFRMKVTSPHVP